METKTARKFTTELIQDDDTAGCGIEMPFDPKEVFGKARVAVVATLNGHSYRTTVAAMDGRYWIPVSRANREAAGVNAGDRVRVSIKADDRPRTITPPKDLAAALKANPVAREVWSKLSFSCRREFATAVEEAKRPETRQKRVDAAIRALSMSPQYTKKRSPAK
ncbi:MAG: DUF1905 domain-containing protein [Phycisphaerales bacterium]|nr:DUF1905 domain-containing protein [Phycisphaerales bacterium]